MKALRPESHWRQGLHLLSSVVTAPNAVHASLVAWRGKKGKLMGVMKV